MGLKSSLLPDSFLRRMQKADRDDSKAMMTAAEAHSKAAARAEKTFQNEMVNLLNQRNLWFVRSRMDRKTTTRKGVPDFLIVLPGGLALAVEAKGAGGALSPSQRLEHSRYFNQTRTDVRVVYNLPQFRELLDQHANQG